MATEALTEKFRVLINDCTQSPVEEILINPNWGKISFESSLGALIAFKRV